MLIVFYDPFLLPSLFSSSFLLLLFLVYIEISRRERGRKREENFFSLFLSFPLTVTQKRMKEKEEEETHCCSSSSFPLFPSCTRRRRLRLRHKWILYLAPRIEAPIFPETIFSTSFQFAFAGREGGERGKVPPNEVGWLVAVGEREKREGGRIFWRRHRPGLKSFLLLFLLFVFLFDSTNEGAWTRWQGGEGKINSPNGHVAFFKMKNAPINMGSGTRLMAG